MISVSLVEVIVSFEVVARAIDLSNQLPLVILADPLLTFYVFEPVDLAYGLVDLLQVMKVISRPI